MAKGETIVAAAIQWEGQSYALPAPARHVDVIRYIYAIGICDGPFFSDNQGFLTSEGRFVSRFEALIIAREAKQLTRPATGILFSEDLW